MKLDVAQLAIPADVDLTTRQILKLAIVALRKTLEEYQRPQTQPLAVSIVIEGTDDAKASLRDLGAKFAIGRSRLLRIDSVFSLFKPGRFPL